MAEEEEENVASIQPEFPTGRVKRIMRIDKEVQRVSSEALFLVTCSTELFLQFLAEKSARVAIEKKRKTVKLEHLRIAVKRHQPTSDFLLDSLPHGDPPAPPSHRSKKPDKPDSLPHGTRRIDSFFRKPVAEAESEAEAEVEEEVEEEEEAEAEAEVEDEVEVEAEAEVEDEVEVEAEAEEPVPVPIDES